MLKRFEPVEGRNADIIECVMTCSEVAGLSEDVKFKIRLCVEEVEENILCYSGSTWVEVSVKLSNGELVVSFRDGGVEFDPRTVPEPDIEASVEERKIGGLGIMLCRRFMDRLDYSFVEGCNMFSMSKRV